MAHRAVRSHSSRSTLTPPGPGCLQTAQLARLRAGLGDDPSQRARLHILESERRLLQEQLRAKGSVDSQEVVSLSLQLAEERGATAELERQLEAAGRCVARRVAPASCRSEQHRADATRVAAGRSAKRPAYLKLR